MKGLFVTGTDTDIGKTIVSSILALGTNSMYWKPVQSGLDDETDTEFIEKYLSSERIFKEAFRLKIPYHQITPQNLMVSKLISTILLFQIPMIAP